MPGFDDGIKAQEKVHITAVPHSIVLYQFRKIILDIITYHLFVHSMPCVNLQILRTNFSLEVHWDGDNTVDVLIDETFKNRTCGLCGNFNDDSSDDFKNPNATLVSKTNLENSGHLFEFQENAKIRVFCRHK